MTVETPIYSAVKQLGEFQSIMDHLGPSYGIQYAAAMDSLKDSITVQLVKYVDCGLRVAYTSDHLVIINESEETGRSKSTVTFIERVQRKVNSYLLRLTEGR